ncbi:MAG: peptide ABC transporter substrate-binding protein [Pirellulales bacterium]
MSSRLNFSILAVVLTLTGVAWAVYHGRLPPADFTFNNATEIKSLDPALVTGVPEGRIIEGIYEGLVQLHPQTRQPQPGAAERWEISDDKLTYTFHIRKNAVWTNSDPVTAHDFVYSLRRFIDPRTASQYAYQAWYAKNAKRYTLGSAGIKPGDPVEVELNLEPGEVETKRGKLLHGTLVEIIEREGMDPKKYQPGDRVLVVEIDGKQHKFTSSDKRGDLPKDLELCRQVLLDFREVGIRAVDDHTLVTELAYPTPFWLQLMGFYPLFPVNQKCIEEHGAPYWTYPENIVTNGAYDVVLRRVRDRVRLAKSDTYWDRDNVKLNTIDALAVEQQTTGYNLYELGEVDWIVDPPPVVLREKLKSGESLDDLNPSRQFGTYYYLLNTTRPPLNDPRVRRALVLALDRAEITRVATGAGEQPARSLVPPGLPQYQSQMHPEENIEEARRLFAEAGYPEGRGFPRLEILYNTHEQHQTVAELVRKQWQRALGITVVTRNQEWPTVLDAQNQLKFDVSRRSWIGDYLDPYTFLDMFVTGGENNNTGWSNAKYDQLITDAKVEPDEQNRLAMLAEAERILMEELPIVPIYYYVSRNMVKPHIRGFYNNLQDIHPLRAIWIDREGETPSDYAPGGGE